MPSRRAQVAPTPRVALFSGNYNYVRDGANQALNRLVEYLERQGVAVRVYSPTSPTPAFAPAGTLVSVPSIRIPGRDEYRFSLGMSAAVRADIEAFKPTLFHLSAPDVLGHRAKALAAELGVPVVASVHTRFETYFSYYRLGWLRRWAENVLRRFYSDLPEIYAPSESMAEVLREQGMSDKIAIWSRGVEHDVFNPGRRSIEWRRGLGVSDDERLIAFVGRLVLEKGLDVLADTSAELSRRGVAHRVLIVGEGPARAWIAERLPAAIFTGHLAGVDLARAYASADLLFNPSTTETFGNVTLEAMASGLAVVAADATGTSSLVEHGGSGRLVTPGDIAGYAEATAGYLADPASRARAAARGRKLAARYDWEAINAEMLAHYRAVIGAARPARGAVVPFPARVR